MNAVTWANFTPTDTADGTATWTNRALACQGKQFNLQTMLSGRTTIASNRTNIRNGIQDALTNLPSGTGGATLGGGWNAAENAMKRFARLGETIFVTGGAGTNANPSSLVAEGTITDANVVLAINS
jgi:CubicO group peptidase (beta-lactamase class C family)